MTDEEKRLIESQDQHDEPDVSEVEHDAGTMESQKFLFPNLTCQLICISCSFTVVGRP